MLTKRTINNIEKSMPARNGVSLAKDIKDIEFDLLKNLTDDIQEDFRNDKKGGVVDLAKYRKSKEPKIKKLNLSQGDYDRAVIDVQSQSDRDLIKQLLKMSGINVGKGKD